MDTRARLVELMDERHWSEYRLAIESGLSQFFAEGTLVELTAEQQEMFAAWSTLSREQKDVLRQLIQVMKKKDA